MTKNPKQQPKANTSTGAGAEAAEGMKTVSGQRGAEPTKSDKGAVSSPAKSAHTIAHPGSEPLEQRETEHESGYGGKGGEPRTSSDKRETTGKDGSLRSDSNKR